MISKRLSYFTLTQESAACIQYWESFSCTQRLVHVVMKNCLGLAQYKHTSYITTGWIHKATQKNISCNICAVNYILQLNYIHLTIYESRSITNQGTSYYTTCVSFKFYRCLESIWPIKGCITSYIRVVQWMDFFFFFIWEVKWHTCICLLRWSPYPYNIEWGRWDAKCTSVYKAVPASNTFPHDYSFLITSYTTTKKIKGLYTHQ